MHMRDLISLVEAAQQEPYQTLADAGADYAPGETEIWYAKQQHQSGYQQGYDQLAKSNQLPDSRSIYRTHSMIGTVQETDPARVLGMMQSEAWNPNGLAQPMLAELGLSRSNMQTGDIIVANDQMFLVDLNGKITALGDNSENQ